ncbi:MAG: proline dehydrogenase family protein [Anaerolineales bacterium]
MLRTPLLYLSNAHWARTLVTRLGFARRAASRFVAGETADDAIAAIQNLNAQSINATLDHLGESVSTEAEAQRAADSYLLVLEKIQAARVCSNVSIKLTQFGLDLGEAFCVATVRRVIEQARQFGNFVRIDMEGSAYTDRTLAVFGTLRQEFDNVGIVLQAYLYRTEADLQSLLAVGARVRLCKGAYQEPADKAFPLKGDVDENYFKLARMLLDAAPNWPPAGREGRLPPLPGLATHDEKLVSRLEGYIGQIGLPREYFEFQMLYGIRRDLQQRLAAKGWPVRVYVPYGTEWYPYFMRRLAERPANVWFFVSNLVKR